MSTFFKKLGTSNKADFSYAEITSALKAITQYYAALLKKTGMNLSESHTPVLNEQTHQFASDTYSVRINPADIKTNRLDHIADHDFFAEIQRLEKHWEALTKKADLYDSEFNRLSDENKRIEKISALYRDEEKFQKEFKDFKKRDAEHKDLLTAFDLYIPRYLQERTAALEIEEQKLKTAEQDVKNRREELFSDERNLVLIAGVEKIKQPTYLVDKYGKNLEGILKALDNKAAHPRDQALHFRTYAYARKKLFSNMCGLFSLIGAKQNINKNGMHIFKLENENITPDFKQFLALRRLVKQMDELAMHLPSPQKENLSSLTEELATTMIREYTLGGGMLDESTSNTLQTLNNNLSNSVLTQHTDKFHKAIAVIVEKINGLLEKLHIDKHINFDTDAIKLLKSLSENLKKITGDFAKQEVIPTMAA